MRRPVSGNADRLTSGKIRHIAHNRDIIVLTEIHLTHHITVFLIGIDDMLNNAVEGQHFLRLIIRDFRHCKIPCLSIRSRLQLHIL